MSKLSNKVKKYVEIGFGNKNTADAFVSELESWSGGGGGTWGSISGSLVDQTDLSAALDDKAEAAHTHALTDITQSSATLNQVPVWDGTAWVPQTISGSGTPTWGSITGTLSNQTDLNSALAGKQAAITVGPNKLLGTDNTGVIEAIPAYFIDTRLGGLHSSVSANPNDNNQGFQFERTQISLNPLQNSDNDQYNIRETQVTFDAANSGFNLGVNGTAIRFDNKYINHNGTGNLGQVEFLTNSFGIGNGTDAIEFKGFGYSFGFGNINDNVTVVGQMQGYGFQPNVAAGATLQNAYVQAFYDNTNIQCASDGHTSFNASPYIAEMPDGRNFSGYNVNPSIPLFTGNGSFTGIGVYGNLGSFENGGYQAININPTVASAGYAVGVNVDMSNVTVKPGAKASVLIQDLKIEMQQPGQGANDFTIEYISDVTAGSETASLAGQAITVHIEDGVTTAAQVKTAIEADFTLNSNLTVTVVGSSSTLQTVQAATSFAGGLNAGNKRAAYFKGDVQVDGAFSFTGALSIGAINAFAEATLVDGGGNPSSIHQLITQPTIGDNITLANADMLAINTAALFNIGENSVITTSFLGLTALGLPAVLTMKTGSTVDRVTGATFALSLDSSGTGGTIDKVALCRALAIPNGVTAVNEMYAYEMDLPFGDAATQTWGLMIRPEVGNYLAGALKIGGTTTVTNSSVALEIESATKAFVLSRLTTVQRDALTAVEGMVIFNTTLSVMQCYNGTAWV